MYDLHLFAGSGIFASGRRETTIGYVEFASYPQQILMARIRDGYLDDAPIWSNVKTFTKRNQEARPFIRQLVKIRHHLRITAGFPCQPFSIVGRRKSNDDMRNGWPDTIRIIGEIRPQRVYLENVRGLLSAMDKTQTEPSPYFGTILGQLARIGYVCKWGVLSARSIGAPHLRERVWIRAELANPEQK